MAGISSIGVYVPRTRLSRKAIADANRWFAGGLAGLAKGERSVCSWDEDSITMAVEASRAALEGGAAPQSIWFASTSAPFQDRLNAGVVAIASGLPESVAAMDIGGSLRSGTSALARGLADCVNGDVMVVASEQRLAKAASQDEMLFGDAAAALVLSSEPTLAEIVAVKQRSVDFVDHYRASTHAFDYGWEERWIRDEGYLKIVPPLIAELLSGAGVAPEAIAHFVMPAPASAIANAVAAKAKIKLEAVRDSLQPRLGFSGSAHPFVMLASALEDAKPGDLILMTGFGQGCDLFLLKVLQPAAKDRAGSVAAQLARGTPSANYMRYLSHNELIEQERGIRAELDAQTPPSVLYRNRRMILGFVGGKCRKCGTVQFPKTPVCVGPNCGAFHQQDDHSFAGSEASVQSFTADALTYTPDPPARYGMMKFADGGCLMMDLTDVAEGEITVGAKVRMMFRIKAEDHRRGFKRYFWKAAPAAATA